MFKRVGTTFISILLGLYITVQLLDIFSRGNVVQGAKLNDELINYDSPNESFEEKFKKGKIFHKINIVLKERGLAEAAECSIHGSEHYFMIEAKIKPIVHEEENRKEIYSIINEILRVNGYEANTYDVYIKD
jgi:CRISPR/Cas system-associated exonuclease Cas4 (RecB family)